MNKTPLPTVRLTLSHLPNPAWKSGDSMDTYYISAEVDVEIVQLNLNSGGMRIRFTWEGKVVTRDTLIAPFFEKYSIVQN